MSISSLPPVQSVREDEEEVGGSSPWEAPGWWPLAHSEATFVPLDRQSCRDFLGRSGTGWLSRPGVKLTPRRLVSYTITPTELRFVPPLAIDLPVGDVVLFQVAHFDARARTAWSVVLVGPSEEYAFGSHPRLYASAPPVALPLESTGIFGSRLATAPRPGPRTEPEVHGP